MRIALACAMAGIGLALAAAPVLAAPVVQLAVLPAHSGFGLVSSPTLAYVITLIGLYGLLFEFSAPGRIIPGVLGAGALVVGLASLNALPLNFGGLGLVLLAFGLFLVEVKLVTHGFLVAAGTASLLAGSLLLFHGGDRVALPAILIATALNALFFLTLVRLGLRARKAPPTTGVYALVGRTGEVRTDLRPVGQVVVNGEWWRATSDEPIEAGAHVEVLGVQGLTLMVRRQ